jgi:hypothetical protein
VGWGAGPGAGGGEYAKCMSVCEHHVANGFYSCHLTLASDFQPTKDPQKMQRS